MLEGDLAAQGWQPTEDSGFIHLIGPTWQRLSPDGIEIAIHTADKHRNRAGNVHGGLFCTIADRAIGMAARLRNGGRSHATIELSMKFIGAVTIGRVLEVRPKIIRETRSLIFGTADLISDGKQVGHATGIFKLL